ncbi:F0F1 ATP synthase subunit epsilon [Propylenella binzhouense]|uniref:ATP synthase epsilon chain n=1 Tax=Propylenella binzhouense TaxID=2555902 RepID=A0A964WUX3_9HYPH|nr:F0F1 ATP synthase subunit epsilon [Propylenella binzhouense]MYZ49280.1 F0F1 ATP synthase subunit epsilon [Propylenella binzhouense]
MAGPLHFDLVSPERLLISEEVAQVVVPGVEGYFTVLADHAPFMTIMKPGVVEITGIGGDVRRIFVRGGFADVSGSALTVLAEYAVRVEELNAEMIAKQVRDAEEDLVDFGEDHVRRAAAEKHLNDLRDVQRWIIPA